MRRKSFVKFASLLPRNINGSADPRVDISEAQRNEYLKAIIPEPIQKEITVVRVDGRMICTTCNKAYKDHPQDRDLPYPTFVLLCDGTHAKT